jgi:hypothetical protein
MSAPRLDWITATVRTEKLTVELEGDRAHFREFADAPTHAPQDTATHREGPSGSGSGSGSGERGVSSVRDPRAQGTGRELG